MIYDYFRVTGAHYTVLNYVDLFSITLCDDNVQEFDTRWDEVLPFMSKIPSDDVLESLYKLRERLSDQLKTVLELYDMEFHQKISVVTKGKGQNSYTERKTGESFQRKAVGSCSRRDNCSFLHTHATGHREIMWKEVGDARRSHLEQASSSVPKVREQTDVKSSNSLKASPATGAENPLSMDGKMKKIDV